MKYLHKSGPSEFPKRQLACGLDILFLAIMSRDSVGSVGSRHDLICRNYQVILDVVHCLKLKMKTNAQKLEFVMMIPVQLLVITVCNYETLFVSRKIVNSVDFVHFV